MTSDLPDDRLVDTFFATDLATQAFSFSNQVSKPLSDSRTDILRSR